MSKIDYPLKSYHGHFNDPDNCKNPTAERRYQKGPFKPEHDALTRKHFDSLAPTVFTWEKAASTNPKSILRFCRRWPSSIHHTVNPKRRHGIPSLDFVAVSDRWMNNYFLKRYSLEGTDPKYCSRPSKKQKPRCFFNWTDRD